MEVAIVFIGLFGILFVIGAALGLVAFTRLSKVDQNDLVRIPDLLRRVTELERRLGDERRWVDAGTPGDMEDMSDRVRLCFPIGLGERRANPNVGPDHVDPKNPLYHGTLP